MERRALIAWLLELIRRAPEPVMSGSAEPGEAIELSFRGRRWLIRVDELAS